MVNRFRGKFFDSVTCLKINNTIITEDKEKADALAQHYDNMAKDSNLDPDFKIIKITKEKEFDENLPNIRHDNENNLNKNFTMFELNQALNSKRNSSPGGDTIAYEMLKQLPNESKIELLKLINTSWERGEVPPDWKLATVIPLLKQSKDKLEPQSYRPISLTSCICKTLETMIAKRLTPFLEKNHLISSTQSGFRPGRSTLDQCTRLQSEINMAFMEQKILVAISLDLEKAFDLMWAKGTLIQLQKYGITGKFFQWIRSFLKDRKIQVRLGNTLSEQHDLENGCPQGSVISPILFNLIINTLHKTLEEHKKISLSGYADDSTVWRKHHCPKLAIKDLQAVLNIIEIWSKEWGFKISSTKTKAIIFTQKRNLKTEQLNLTMFGQKIEFVKQIKLLGMIFDSKLLWDAHITNLIDRCKKDINLLRLVSATTFGADKLTLLNLYKSLILSKIDYGAHAYFSAQKSSLKKLELDTKCRP